jgi:hypothetical protein
VFGQNSTHVPPAEEPVPQGFLSHGQDLSGATATAVAAATAPLEEQLRAAQQREAALLASLDRGERERQRLQQGLEALDEERQALQREKAGGFSARVFYLLRFCE